MKVQLFLILSVWSCAEWSRVDGQMMQPEMMGSPRFLPGLNQNRFNNHQMMPQRPPRQRPPPPSPMNRPPQPEREPQSSHPTSGKEFHVSAIFGH